MAFALNCLLLVARGSTVLADVNNGERVQEIRSDLKYERNETTLVAC